MLGSTHPTLARVLARTERRRDRAARRWLRARRLFAALRQATGVASARLGDLAAARGYGPAIAVRWHDGARRQLSGLLLVYPGGTILRATPTYRGETYMPGPPSWTPDGELLAIPWQRAPRAGERGDHAHCLALWSRARGYRPTGCDFYRHFDTVAWARDGDASITDGGQIINRAGRIVARARKVGPAIGTRWTVP